MKEIISEAGGLSNFLQDGDAFFLDRGFRDVVTFLEEKNYRVHMPALKGAQTQLTTAQANSSRQVTMVRWVVEAVHGILGQKNKLLHQQFDNKMIPDAMSYIRIACFMQNKFGKRCVSKLSTDPEVLAQIRGRLNEENTLAADCESARWNTRRVIFQNLTSKDILDFPVLTTNDLEVLFTGTY